MREYLLQKELIKNYKIYVDSNDKQEALRAFDKCKAITKLITKE